MAASSITCCASWRHKVRALRLLAVGAALALSGCSVTVNNNDTRTASSYARDAAPTVETLTATELAALVDSGEVVLIDVRTPAEFAEQRLAGALNAPVQTFDAASIPRDETREVILYCRSSGRSERAAIMLADEWGGTVRHLEGGIIAWNDAGLPTIK
ncbi:rhodanese-like domain-containing protein [Qipengyuania sp. DGS5-3]|uniref:rhodanese-like domain-containing protein n=1 Tax=Qipengyuania sp. DGS5-3 TaxID=3349632 RepID=UPI0036D2BB2A